MFPGEPIKVVFEFTGLSVQAEKYLNVDFRTNRNNFSELILTFLLE